MALDEIDDVRIDSKGVFKYILIKVIDRSSDEQKLIVRGYLRCKWHKNILRETEKEVGSKYILKCVGGGRIRHEPNDLSLFVYGYSQRYGPAKHEESVRILKAEYPSYSVDFSYDGY